MEKCYYRSRLIHLFLSSLSAGDRMNNKSIVVLFLAIGCVQSGYAMQSRLVQRLLRNTTALRQASTHMKRNFSSQSDSSQEMVEGAAWGLVFGSAAFIGGAGFGHMSLVCVKDVFDISQTPQNEKLAKVIGAHTMGLGASMVGGPAGLAAFGTLLAGVHIANHCRK